MIARNDYLNRLIKNMWNGEVKVIAGLPKVRTRLFPKLSLRVTLPRHCEQEVRSNPWFPVELFNAIMIQ